MGMFELSARGSRRVFLMASRLIKCGDKIFLDPRYPRVAFNSGHHKLRFELLNICRRSAHHRKGQTFADLRRNARKNAELVSTGFDARPWSGIRPDNR